MASITRKTIRPHGLSYLGSANVVRVKVIESDEYCLSFFAHTAWPIMVSNKPIIASHSSVYNICPHFRNLKDDQLYAIKENGGVVFINFYPTYIDSTFAGKEKNMKELNKPLIDSLSAIYGKNIDAGWYKVSEELNPYYQSIVPTLKDVVDHIDYVKNLIGINHVGIGADWDGVEVLPKNIEHIGKLPSLTKELIDRGYSKTEIKKVLGENFKRVFREVSQ